MSAKLRLFSLISAIYVYSFSLVSTLVLHACGCRRHKERDANNIMAMTWTWIHNDISANETFDGDLDAALGAITAKTVLMPGMTDLYFRTADSEEELQHLQDGRLQEIPSIWGHMCGAGQHEADTEFIDQTLKALLAS